MSESKILKEKRDNRVKMIAIITMVVLLMAAIGTVIVNSISYYTVRINYFYSDGSPAHDPYIATFSVREPLDYVVTNPNVSGFDPMMLTEEGNDPAALPTGGVSAPTTHIETNELNGDITYNVYYIAGLTHYAARYYLQNVYDDLYTLDRDRTNANQNRLGKTGTAPADLEAEEIDGFTSLFHEPDAIAADGSTVFRVYYDRNYYSINFDLGEGGYGVDPIYAKYESVYRIDHPQRMGYTFLGWARTNADSSNGEEGVDWHYIDADGNKINKAQATASENLVQLEGDQYVPAKNTYYQAVWQPGTSSFTVIYWIENADNNGYTALLAKDVYQVEENDRLVDVVAGTTVTPNTVVRNYAKKAKDEGIYNGSGARNDIVITDLFSFNLNYANPDDPRNEDPEIIDENTFVYKYDTYGVPIDFKDISKGTSEELAGCGDFFEMNAHDDTSVDEKYRTDASVTVRGDGTSRFNVFFRRKTFTLKFFYARQKYNDQDQLETTYSTLTNSTKGFNQQAYLDSAHEYNYLEALAKGSWESDCADSLPQVKSEYLAANGGPISEVNYVDFKDKTVQKKKYRYYYYVITAKYNEPLTNKWLIDALGSVHRTNAAAKEICIPGSIATEYHNRYYQERKNSGNFTVKGIYEKLGKGIMFTDDARATMKQNNLDYTELHFLISWTNTSNSNGWNSSITRVLHFRYENYVELLPREIELLDHSGQQAVLDEGNYISIKQFTTKVKNESGNYVEKTKWYGLSTDHIAETIDSGNQYDRNKSLADRNDAVYKNQTPTAMTGYEIEYYRVVNGLITLDNYNTEIDWSEDTNDYRRCTIKFFYRRREYTLKYRNGNRKDESHTRTVMYGAYINSQYIVAEDGHEAGDYRYYWPDPEYFDENRRDFFTFDGWYNDPRYEDPFDLDTQTMPADDDTLFAKWSPKRIDVIFYDDYDDFYVDRKGNHPEKRIVLGKDEDDNDITDVNVEYGSYVPNNLIPVNDDNPDNPRPKLTPIAEGASFAGWYYIRNRVPVRYEPENVPVIALNEESVGENAKLRLFAEWVTKDVAKYKVSYVKDSDGTEIAAPTTGRAYVWKTKTFNAKSGNELYDEYKWTQEGENEGTNWWPTTNSSSMVIKANNTDDEYAPNNLEFRYIQKAKVYYKVQYLDAATRKPLTANGEDVIKESTHASVTEDARIIPGYIARTATQSMVLTASSNPDPEVQRAEELENNVITFLYDENKNEYMYEVEYLTQDLGANTYSVYTSETLTIQKTGDGAVTLSVADLYNKEIPQHILGSGFARVAGGNKYAVTNADGVRDPNLIPLADDGTVQITGTDKKTIMLYYSRNSYSYKYQYVDQSAEKNYLNYLEEHKDDPDPTAGAPWNGVLETFGDPSYIGQVQQVITINPDLNYTYTDPSTQEQTAYTRVTNENGTLNDVTLTIQPDDDWNLVKIYYRKDTERELNYQMVCVNQNPDTDYYPDGTPKFGRLNFTIQTVQDYDGIQNNTFYDNNNETDEHDQNLHLHKYTFLGWYTTPTYDEEHPETNRITTNATLTKEALPTGTELPANRTTYYALVKQDMVTMDVMFYYTDDYTVDEFKAEDSDTLEPIIQQAIDNEYNAQVPDAQKVHPTGKHVGKEVTFTAPNGYQNHTEIAWHRTDGYSLNMDDTDERVYKYQFAEWWEVDESNNNTLIRHDNWNSSEGWDPDALSQQLSRNRNQYLIAVYARRVVEEMPYTINYHYVDRRGENRKYVVKGTLYGDELKDSSKVTNDGDFRLTDDFIFFKAPYESNHGENLIWSNSRFEKTSVKGGQYSGTKDEMITDVYAVQEKKKVNVYYRLAPNDLFSLITTDIGSNRSTDPNLAVLDVRGKEYEQKRFSYWEIRKSDEDNAPVIAKCYEPWFTYVIWEDYFITPVFNSDTENNGNLDGDAKIILTAIDKTRNQWTDDDGNMLKDAYSDYLYCDFEVAFADGSTEIYNNSDYQAGLVFEICNQLNGNQTFNPAECNYQTHTDNLKDAIKNILYSSPTGGNGKFVNTNGKKRSIQVNPISTADLTNRSRIEYAKPYRNVYKTGNEGEKIYTNGAYIYKVSAYLIDKVGNVTLSDPVYACLYDVAKQDLATRNMLVYEAEQG